MSLDRLDPVTRERAKVRELEPSLNDFKGLKGFRHQVKRAKDGRILKQRYRFTANDGQGNLTPQAKAVQEMYKPYWNAKLGLEAKLRGLPGDFGGRGNRLAENPAPRTYFACGHYSDTGATACQWCDDGR